MNRDDTTSSQLMKKRLQRKSFICTNCSQTKTFRTKRKQTRRNNEISPSSPLINSHQCLQHSLKVSSFLICFLTSLKQKGIIAFFHWQLSSSRKSLQLGKLAMFNVTIWVLETLYRIFWSLRVFF